MQDRMIEELELDLKELTYLLKQVEKEHSLIPITKRHISRFIKSLEDIREKVEGLEETLPAGLIETVNVEEEDLVEEKSATVIGERLKPSAELLKGFSLNDTFRFSRELFDGDKDKMNRVLHEISGMRSLTDVIAHLSSQIEWNEDDDTIKDLVELLKKYFV